MTSAVDPSSLLEEWQKRIDITNKMWNLNLETIEILPRDSNYDITYKFQLLNQDFFLRVSLKKLLKWNDCEITSFHLTPPELCPWWGNALTQWQMQLEEEKEFECLMQGLEELSALMIEQNNVIDFLRNGSYSDCLSFDYVNHSLSVKHVKDCFCVEWKIVWDCPAQAFAHNVIVDVHIPGIQMDEMTILQIINQLSTRPEETKSWLYLCKLAKEKSVLRMEE